MNLKGALWGAVAVLLIIVLLQLRSDGKRAAALRTWKAKADSAVVQNIVLLGRVDSFRVWRGNVLHQLALSNQQGAALASEAERLRRVIAAQGGGPVLPPTAPADCAPWVARVAFLEQQRTLLGRLADTERQRAVIAEAARDTALMLVDSSAVVIDSLAGRIRVADSLLSDVPLPRPVKLALVFEGRARLTGEGEVLAGLRIPFKRAWLQVSGVADHRLRRSIEAKVELPFRVL